MESKIQEESQEREDTEQDDDEEDKDNKVAEPQQQDDEEEVTERQDIDILLQRMEQVIEQRNLCKRKSNVVSKNFKYFIKK